MTTDATAPPTAGARSRDLYLDALRAGALLVVVFGHWLATLPRTGEDGRTFATDHLLHVWDAAGPATWLLQVVPLFVFVSAAVAVDAAARRAREPGAHRRWWAGRALALARPTVTYLAVLAVLGAGSFATGGRLLGPLDHSLTVHLWFLLMLLAVQAVLPLSVEADRRFGLLAPVLLLGAAVVFELARARPSSVGQLAEIGNLVTSTGGGPGWVNALLIWLLPQQLGVAWRRGRFAGPAVGAGLIALGGVWLLAAVSSGYPTAMVGGDLHGNSNVLPPTLALVGVMWLQVGLVLLAEPAARRVLTGRGVRRTVTVLATLSMPLYLWHKLAELPALVVAETVNVGLDHGVPGDAAFWAGRAGWLVLCSVAVAPVLVGVVAFERRRRTDVAATGRRAVTIAGGVALVAGLTAALTLGTVPGAPVALALVAYASWQLRQR